MNLSNGWELIVIPYNRESPMVNHKGNEIAADEELKTFYCWETWMVAAGTISVIKACETYISNWSK